MKKIFFIIIATIFCVKASAQVSIVTDGLSSNPTKKHFAFSGDRTLYAIGMNDKLTENYIVVSKNKRGASSDFFYIEKFTKNGKNKFDKTYTAKLKHPVNLSLGLSNNRRMYSDIDKDGNVEFLYVVQEFAKGPNTPLTRINGVIAYKNKVYTMWVTAKDNFKKTSFSENFKDLPSKVNAEFMDYWNGMAKN